jgi:hypothetical protein
MKHIPRNDELHFTQLVMNCVRLIVAASDRTLPQPGLNYKLELVDRFLHWPMRSLSAKAAWDASLQVSMTLSVPKVKF